MNAKQLFLASWCLLSALTSCQQQPDDIIPVDPRTPGNIPTFPAGAPKGVETTFTVTPDGGEFSSPDHTLKLIIPAGAVKATQEFSMQTIENTAPAGSGQAIRLQPHGTQFDKPITIQFSYADINDQLSSTSFLDVAYQDQKGNWRFSARPVVNRNAKTVSVQTTHFSDWVIAETARLTPSQSTIEASEQQTLHVLQFIDPIDEENPFPLVSGDDLYMTHGTPLPTKYIKNNGQPDAWQLGGTGELSPIGAKAIYSAPKRMLEPATANVMVELFNPATPQTRHFLISTIQVVTGTGVSYRVSGGSWQSLPNALVTEIEPNRYGLASIVDPIRITFKWEGGLGTHRWNAWDEFPPDFATTGGISNINTYIFSQTHHETPDGTVNSGGGITITELDKAKGVVRGTFKIQSAGVYNPEGQLRQETIEGHFKANFMSVANIPR